MDGLSLNGHAFLIGGVIPAFHYGEKLVVIDAEILNEIKEGLENVMNVFKHWYYEEAKDVARLESRCESFIFLRRNRRALCFSPEL